MGSSLSQYPPTNNALIFYKLNTFADLNFDQSWNNQSDGSSAEFIFSSITPLQLLGQTFLFVENTLSVEFLLQPNAYAYSFCNWYWSYADETVWHAFDNLTESYYQGAATGAAYQEFYQDLYGKIPLQLTDAMRTRGIKLRAVENWTWQGSLVGTSRFTADFQNIIVTVQRIKT